ncbi:MAG: hypothetical protein WCK37_05045 [Candidatus Falkowbacteria bacterium]
MIHTFAYSLFLGKPLIMYGGLLTLLLILSTATIGALNLKGITIIPLKWHFRLALITILVALGHGILGLSLYFNF